MGFRRWNRNVQVALGYTYLQQTAIGIWGFAVLSGYLKVLTGENAKVGLAEGLQGMCQALTALPAGSLADSMSRQKVLQGASVLGFVAVAGLIVSIHGGGSHEFVLVCCFLGLFGSFIGAVTSPLEALFADSLASSERTKFLQYKYSLRVLANATGPLTSTILFFFIGDSWTLRELKMVMSIGILLCVPTFALLFCFKDKLALGDESEALMLGTPDAGAEQGLEYQLLEETEEARARRKSAMYWVPRICTSADVITGVASGMTIKFFPLFFKEESLMSPVQVSLLYVVAQGVIAVMAIITRKAASRIGRVQAAVLFASPSVMLLIGMYLMSVGYDIKVPGSVPLWRNKSVILPVYIIRTAFINSTWPLKKSILMDYVPKKSRGKWNALESVTRFGWSGSAVLGGLLVDHYGYGKTFLFTAVLQGISYVMIAVLIIWVKK